MSAVRLITPQLELDFIPFNNRPILNQPGLCVLISGSRLDSRVFRSNVPLFF